MPGVVPLDAGPRPTATVPLVAPDTRSVTMKKAPSMSRPAEQMDGSDQIGAGTIPVAGSANRPAERHAQRHVPGDEQWRQAGTRPPRGGGMIDLAAGTSRVAKASASGTAHRQSGCGGQSSRRGGGVGPGRSRAGKTEEFPREGLSGQARGARFPPAGWQARFSATTADIMNRFIQGRLAGRCLPRYKAKEVIPGVSHQRHVGRQGDYQQQGQ